MSQNLKSPNPDDKETRLERRWKRREAMNDSLKHNHVASATKTPAEICENTTILIDESDHTIDDDTNEDCEILLGECTGVNDEVEADYKSLLAKYSPVIETDSGSNHIDGSNIVEVEADYGSLLAKYNPIIDTDSASNHIDGSNIDEVEADYGSLLAKYNLNIDTDSASNHIDGSKIDEVDSDADADYRSFLRIYDSDVEIVGYGESNDSEGVDAVN